ncbi:unnamed protein product [Chilo suppressalis]|uniref:Cytochrome b561 domain-containing protein n=1 Tax=Chilo suppressalis TaxID=168631 RepID=A0ABN8B1V8_CHISP|nr:unnamed protein product [Chilo suppressalis]
MTVSDESGPAIVKLLDIVNTIATVAIGGLAMGGLLTATLYSSTILSNLSTHIFLVTFGYILIISQAVVSMNPTAGWARAFSYQNKRMIHLCMQIIGSILAIAGAAMGMRLRNSFGTSRTPHGIMVSQAQTLTDSYSHRQCFYGKSLSC